MTDAKDIVDAIDNGYLSDKEEKSRAYLGASIIGNQCDALLAFNLRGFPNEPPSPRLKRIFRLGHILEDEVVKDLKKRAKLDVWEVDGLTGRQHSYELWGGHIKAHMDGHIELNGEVHVLEIKSMNDASHAKFKKNGVKISHPQYFAQVQMMMGMSGIQKSLFIAVNKNTSEYHAEIVEFDDFEYAHIQERIERVVTGRVHKIATDETDWRCRGCFKRGVCWGDREVQVTCATCKFSGPNPQGGWHCYKHDKTADQPCDDYVRYQPESRNE